MTSGKKNKKQKTRQRTRTSEIADGEPESQRSVTDPPPPLSLSLSGPTATTDNAVDRGNHGDHRRSPELGSDRRTASSPLPVLTTSDHDEDEARVRRPSQPSGPAEKSSHISRDTISSAPNRRGSQRATLEEVSDEDDRRQLGPTRTSSARNDKRTDSRESDHAEVAIKLAVVPPTPTHGPRTVPEYTPSDRYNRLPGSSPVLSSSPYPSGIHQEEEVGSDIPSDSDRRARRAEKQRRNRADSIESAELHIAATRSLDQRRVNEESDASHHPNIWNDRNIKAANEALARDRSLHESTEVFQRRRAAWARSEQRLREFRVEDDRIIAEELYVDQLRESQDRELAEQLHRDQQNVERERKEFDTRRRIMDEYIERERAQLGKPRTAAIPEVRREGSRLTTRPLLAPGRDPSEERPEGNNRATHTFNDRVILQRFRCADLAAGQLSRILDQGIDWDDDGKPYEKGPAPSRVSSVGFGVSVMRGVSQVAPFPQGNRSGHGVSSGMQNERTSPVKDERASPYYSRAGTTPLKYNGGGSGSGGKPPGRGKGKPSIPSDSSSSSSSDEGSRSEESDPTYQPENNYSRSEETDSAWEQDPSVTIEEVTLNASDSQPSQKRTRSGIPYADHPGGNPDDSSSSEDRSKRGSGFNPRKHPEESERSHKKRRHRNSRRNHHSHGSRSHRTPLFEAGDPVMAGYCTIKQILESAVNWEWQENVRARYAATRAAHRGEPRAGYYTGNRRPEARREGPRIAAADREEIKHKLYRIVRRDPAMKDEARAHEPQERGFAAREAVDDRSEPADSSSKPRIEALTPPSVRSEQMRRGYEEPVEDENPYMGEQYESEGEFTWEEVSEYSDYANDERCAHAIEDWEDLPALGDEHSDEESDSESDSRSEEDDNMAEVPGRP
ncbi:hypothetical protein DFH09DRAFT_1101060, partial [Mycena vulgaris]